MQYVGVAEAACRDLSRRRHRQRSLLGAVLGRLERDPVEQNDLYFILETLSPFPSVLP